MSTTTIVKPDLSSNGEPIAFNDRLFAPMRDSSALLGDGAALRARFREDGYLLLRGVLERDRVLSLRENYFARLPEGFLKPGSAPAEGLFSGLAPEGMRAYGTSGHPAYAFARSAQLHALSEDRALYGVAETLLEGPAQPLVRQIVRHFHAGSGKASRAHTDYDYMSQGSDNLVTFWIPLGDCPLESGALVYLDRPEPLSEDHLALLRLVNDRENDARPLSHDLEWTARMTERRWLWTDFRAGDLTVHSPHIVHASLDTTTEAMRLSADLRFQRTGETVDPRWTKAWAADDGA